MNIHSSPAFKECYIMQHGDIRRFATTLADGFSEYNMFKYICDGIYNHGLMRLFWEVSLALLPDNAICIADSNDVIPYWSISLQKAKNPAYSIILKQAE